jgi:hypothetical protein
LDAPPAHWGYLRPLPPCPKSESDSDGREIVVNFTILIVSRKEPRPAGFHLIINNTSFPIQKKKERKERRNKQEKGRSCVVYHFP